MQMMVVPGHSRHWQHGLPSPSPAVALETAAVAARHATATAIPQPVNRVIHCLRIAPYTSFRGVVLSAYAVMPTTTRKPAPRELAELAGIFRKAPVERMEPWEDRAVVDVPSAYLVDRVARYHCAARVTANSTAYEMDTGALGNTARKLDVNVIGSATTPAVSEYLFLTLFDRCSNIAANVLAFDGSEDGRHGLATASHWILSQNAYPEP